MCHPVTAFLCLASLATLACAQNLYDSNQLISLFKVTHEARVLLLGRSAKL